MPPLPSAPPSATACCGSTAPCKCQTPTPAHHACVIGASCSSPPWGSGFPSGCGYTFQSCHKEAMPRSAIHVHTPYMVQGHHGFHASTLQLAHGRTCPSQVVDQHPTSARSREIEDRELIRPGRGWGGGGEGEGSRRDLLFPMPAKTWTGWSRCQQQDQHGCGSRIESITLPQRAKGRNGRVA